MKNICLLKTGGADITPPKRYKTVDIVKAVIDYNKFPVEGLVI